MGVRHVVVHEHAFVSDLVVDANRPVHVHVAGVDELLVELRHGARDVAEVHVQDLLPLPEVPDHLVDVLALHLGERPLAELDRVRVRRHYLDQTLVRGKAAEQHRDTAERLNRRVARVDAQPDAFFLGDRRDDLDPVFQVLPHLLFRVLTVVGLRHLLRDLVVERRRHCARADAHVRRPPHSRGHPVVPEDRNPGPGHVPDGEDHVLDLLVPPRAAQHDVVIELRRHVLDGFQVQAVLFYRKAQLDQVLQLPPAPDRGHGSVADYHVGRAELRRERKELRRRPVDASETDSHETCLSPLRVL